MTYNPGADANAAWEAFWSDRGISNNAKTVVITEDGERVELEHPSVQREREYQEFKRTQHQSPEFDHHGDVPGAAAPATASTAV